MFDVSSRAKLSVSALAERKIASARPRKYGLLLRAEEEMLLYGQALASLVFQSVSGHRRAPWKSRRIWTVLPTKRYGTIKGVFGITSSRVPGTRPGRPIS